MNSFSRHLALVILGGFLSLGAVQADEHVAADPMRLASASYPNRSSQPDNGAIRRANPNSRQGTQSISPSTRAPNLSPAPSRPPTLENGGIGNGYPSRQNAPRPAGTPQRSDH
ncbi:hypothetical protein N5D61_25355 [Pseudomonas sp. GD03842]|uniref:hypothetical protein n=1 Tax=unclassified Pseudomonas TaxID=196821 RepID=UPI000D3683E7|nr:MULTISPECIES: hypothetical protein [unclassified Pseudomonas]MDH0749659.1 hypothetical protein [Pseudomonas sp. GD03842]RAU47572.1 hypothetical protein DBP26_007935 [Pseudomonas sp. RIT 409]RAU49036.1 hypothetical protein DBY65_023830 [Pseudomonas sp. RIT 412]